MFEFDPTKMEIRGKTLVVQPGGKRPTTDTVFVADGTTFKVTKPKNQPPNKPAEFRVVVMR